MVWRKNISKKRENFYRNLEFTHLVSFCITFYLLLITFVFSYLLLNWSFILFEENPANFTIMTWRVDIFATIIMTCRRFLLSDKWKTIRRVLISKIRKAWGNGAPLWDAFLLLSLLLCLNWSIRGIKN